MGHGFWAGVGSKKGGGGVGVHAAKSMYFDLAVPVQATRRGHKMHYGTLTLKPTP